MYVDNFVSDFRRRLVSGGESSIVGIVVLLIFSRLFIETSADTGTTVDTGFLNVTCFSVALISRNRKNHTFSNVFFVF